MIGMTILNQGCVTGHHRTWARDEQSYGQCLGKLRGRAPCGSSLTGSGDRVDNLLMAARSLALCPSGELIPTEQSQQTDTQTSTRTPHSSEETALLSCASVVWGLPFVKRAASSPVTPGGGKRDLNVLVDWLWPQRNIFNSRCTIIEGLLISSR